MFHIVRVRHRVQGYRPHRSGTQVMSQRPWPSSVALMVAVSGDPLATPIFFLNGTDFQTYRLAPWGQPRARVGPRRQLPAGTRAVDSRINRVPAGRGGLSQL